MQCPGQEGAGLAGAGGADALCGARGRLAPPAPEHPAHAETDGELCGV